MVSINFAKANLNKSTLVSPSLTGYTNGSSYTFGIWEGNTLVEVFVLKADALVTLKSKIEGLHLSNINIVHESDMFEHVDFDSFEAHKLKEYFVGVAPDVLNKAKFSYEKLKQQKVFSIFTEPTGLSSMFQSLGAKAKTHHISSALANTALDGEDQMLLLVSDKSLQLVIHKDKKFQSFAQYETKEANDYLYYFLLAAKQHHVDISKIKILVGGEIDQNSPLYTTLKSYIHNLEFFNSSKYKIEGATLPYHYYLPLIIAKACV